MNASNDQLNAETRGAGTPNKPRGRRPNKARPPHQNTRPEMAPRDEREEELVEFLTDLVDLMGMDCKIKLQMPTENEENESHVQLDGPDTGRIIGKKGQVLGALQFIANRVMNRPGSERRYVTVDAEGYRDRRDGTLTSMAKKLGKQAVDEGKIITFEPMNPRDRRVIHLALAKLDGIVTKSDGEGNDRRVQIIPVRR